MGKAKRAHQNEALSAQCCISLSEEFAASVSPKEGGYGGSVLMGTLRFAHPTGQRKSKAKETALSPGSATSSLSGAKPRGAMPASMSVSESTKYSAG